MNDQYINKRIKELQKDYHLTFKLSDDLISDVYKIAYEDCLKNNKQNKKESKQPQQKLQSKPSEKDILLIKKQIYEDIANYMEKNHDIIDVWDYINTLRKQIYLDYKEKYEEHKWFP